MRACWLCSFLLVGCAPAVKPVTSSGPLLVASSRCAGGNCSCRPPQSEGAQREDPLPAAGRKRFELKTGRGLDPTTLTIDGERALAKQLDRAEASCAYVDLAPGKHHVELRVAASDAAQGIAPELHVSEYGVNTHAWYHTFALQCGIGQACLKDDMAAFLEAARAIPRGLHDPCGSTRIGRLAWRAEHSPGTRLEDLVVEFELDVYAFEPHEDPGSPGCPTREKP